MAATIPLRSTDMAITMATTTVMLTTVDVAIQTITQLDPQREVGLMHQQQEVPIPAPNWIDG